MKVFGIPAGTLAAASGTKYSADRAKAGRRGELNTAGYLTRLFGDDDNVWCFHDLWVPGGRGRQGERANIDHVLVTGTRLVVIDSKVWKSGTYWTLGGVTRRGLLAKTPWADKAGTGLAVDRLAERLPHAQVEGITLVWPGGSGRRLNLTLHRPKGGTRSYPADTRQSTRAIRRALGPTAPPDGRITALLTTLLPKPSGVTG